LIACSYDGLISLIPFGGGLPVKTFTLPSTANASPDPLWTPDGQALIVRDLTQGVWLQPLSGSEAKHLTNLGLEKIFDMAWSPDGKQLALARGTQSFDVVLIRHSR
jgi:Tol biopolymer transport system component